MVSRLWPPGTASARRRGCVKAADQFTGVHTYTYTVSKLSSNVNIRAGPTCDFSRFLERLIDNFENRRGIRALAWGEDLCPWDQISTRDMLGSPGGFQGERTPYKKYMAFALKTILYT